MKPDIPSTPPLCPSALAEPGALLHGVVLQGRVVPLERAVPVTQDFIQRAGARGDPRRRLRFASPCLESGCANFDGARCTVATRAADSPHPPSALRPCAIRNACRWFAQEGPRACEACAFVVASPKP